MSERDLWNAARFDPADAGGHYESYFQRANHPERPLGFWIRYTVFSPKDRPRDAIGELWAIWFDGEKGEVHAVREPLPIGSCRFSRGALDVEVGEAVLDQRRLEGVAVGPELRLGWSLRYTSPEPPLLLLPRALYGGPFPKARALVGSPNAVFEGHFTVGDERHAIDGWRGSQNHNWGSKHTDDYAWGQVAGFDDAPDAFLECATGRIKLGPVWTPRFTVLVLRLDGEEYRLNAIPTSLRAHGRFDFFSWDFHTQGGHEPSDGGVEIAGQISATPDQFVGLPYLNPPGGTKTCINSKIARCQLTVRRPGEAPRTLVSRQRAAFEILTDATDHGVRVIASR